MDFRRILYFVTPISFRSTLSPLRLSDSPLLFSSVTIHNHVTLFPHYALRIISSSVSALLRPAPPPLKKKEFIDSSLVFPKSCLLFDSPSLLHFSISWISLVFSDQLSLPSHLSSLFTYAVFGLYFFLEEWFWLTSTLIYKTTSFHFCIQTFDAREKFW